MDNAELLSHFEKRVDEFEKVQGFIEKAKGQASKFAVVVVERVIRSNTEKAEGIVEELIPLMSDMDGVVSGLEGKKALIVEGQQQSRLELEELELRLLIQELTEKAYEKDSAGLKKDLAATDEQIAELDAELEKFRSQLERWQDLGERVGVLEAVSTADELEAHALLASDDDDDDDDEEVSIELESIDVELESVADEIELPEDELEALEA